MSSPPKIELTFVPEDYWDIYVTSSERLKSSKTKLVLNQLGALLIIAALILGILALEIQYLLFKGGFEILMTLSVFMAGYLVYEIWQGIDTIRAIDIHQLKADTTDFIERNQNIESAYLSYDAHSFFLEIDGDFFRHQWDNMLTLQKGFNYISLKWEAGSYIFCQSAMTKEQFNDFRSFLGDKFKWGS